MTINNVKSASTSCGGTGHTSIGRHNTDRPGSRDMLLIRLAGKSLPPHSLDGGREISDNTRARSWRHVALSRPRSTRSVTETTDVDAPGASVPLLARTIQSSSADRRFYPRPTIPSTFHVGLDNGFARYSSPVENISCGFLPGDEVLTYVVAAHVSRENYY